MVLAAVGLGWQQIGGDGGGDEGGDPWLFIQRGDQVVASYPLSGAFRTIELEGDGDGLTIEVGQGSVQVIHASCREKRCLQSGRIHELGEWIACLPNRLLLHIGNQQNQKWDAVVE